MAHYDWEYITGSVATIVGTAYAYYKKRQSNRFEKGLIEALNDKIEIHDYLSSLKHETGSPSAVLTESKNGGGIPTGGNPVYISIFDEANDSDMRSIKKDVQNMPTDMAYNRMLLRLLENNFVFLKTDEMIEGFLKEFYQAEGIKCAYIYKVGSLNNRLYYLSLKWKTEIDKNVNIERALRTTSNNILNTLKN